MDLFLSSMTKIFPSKDRMAVESADPPISVWIRRSADSLDFLLDSWVLALQEFGWYNFFIFLFFTSSKYIASQNDFHLRKIKDNQKISFLSISAPNHLKASPWNDSWWVIFYHFFLLGQLSFLHLWSHLWKWQPFSFYLPFRVLALAFSLLETEDLPDFELIADFADFALLATDVSENTDLPSSSSESYSESYSA